MQSPWHSSCSGTVVYLSLYNCTHKKLPLYTNLRMRRTPGRGKTCSKFHMDFFQPIFLIWEVSVFLQVCVSSFPETRFLIPRLNSARCQQLLTIFSTHEQKGWQRAAIISTQVRSTRWTRAGGTQCSVRLWAGEEESPKVAPAWGHQCPMAPCTKKWRKIGFLKKIWSKSQPKLLRKPHWRSLSLWLTEEIQERTISWGFSWLLGHGPLPRHKIPCSSRKCWDVPQIH